MSNMENPYNAPINQSQPPQPPQGPPAQNGLALASMILGICSLTIGCCCWLHVPLGIAGLICGFLGLNKAKETGVGKGMALAGIICSAIALVLLTILGVVGFVANPALLEAMQDM